MFLLPKLQFQPTPKPRPWTAPAKQLRKSPLVFSGNPLAGSLQEHKLILQTRVAVCGSNSGVNSYHEAGKLTKNRLTPQRAPTFLSSSEDEQAEVSVESENSEDGAEDEIPEKRGNTDSYSPPVDQHGSDHHIPTLEALAFALSNPRQLNGRRKHAVTTSAGPLSLEQANPRGHWLPTPWTYS